MPTVGDYVEGDRTDELVGRVFARTGNPIFGYNNWRINGVYTGEEGEIRVSAEVQSYGRFVPFGDLGPLGDMLDWEEVFGATDGFDF